MFYVFLLSVAAAAAFVYLVFFVSQVPGAKEERLGTLEPLPTDLGKWKRDDVSPSGRAALELGEYREVRVLHEPANGLFASDKLVSQARYRNAETNQITRVEPEVRTRRRRVKVS